MKTFHVCIISVYFLFYFTLFRNIGTCVDQINGYKCQCQAGYTGKDCDSDIGKMQVIRVEKSNSN